MDILRGRIHKYNKDNIDTDVIIPGPYLKIHDHKELGKHAASIYFEIILKSKDALLKGKEEIIKSEIIIRESSMRIKTHS